MLVIIGDEKYAIPLNSIKEITSIEKDSIRNIQGQEVILYRNSVLLIIRLAEVLEVQTSNEDDKEITIVIVKKEIKMQGLLLMILLDSKK